MYGVYVIIGCITGVLTGFTGASGMSVLISILLLLGVPVREVIGLTFVVTMANSGIAAVPYGRRGNIPFLPAILMGAAAAGAVLLGYRVSRELSPMFINWCITIGLGVAGVKFTFFNHTDTEASEKGQLRFPEWTVIFPGVMIGFIIGILGGGGGVFITLLLVFVFGYPTHKALGISLIVMCAAGVPGLVLYAKDGLVNPVAAVAIVLPSTVCSFIAARFANRMSDRAIKRVLGIYLILVSCLLMLKNLHVFGSLSR